jgi:hypothetical protein
MCTSKLQPTFHTVTTFTLFYNIFKIFSITEQAKQQIAFILSVANQNHFTVADNTIMVLRYKNLPTVHHKDLGLLHSAATVVCSISIWTHW